MRLDGGAGGTQEAPGVQEWVWLCGGGMPKDLFDRLDDHETQRSQRSSYTSVLSSTIQVWILWSQGYLWSYHWLELYVYPFVVIKPHAPRSHWLVPTNVGYRVSSARTWTAIVANAFWNQLRGFLPKLGVKTLSTQTSHDIWSAAAFGDAHDGL